MRSAVKYRCSQPSTTVFYITTDVFSALLITAHSMYPCQLVLFAALRVYMFVSFVCSTTTPDAFSLLLEGENVTIVSLRLVSAHLRSHWRFRAISLRHWSLPTMPWLVDLFACCHSSYTPVPSTTLVSPLFLPTLLYTLLLFSLHFGFISRHVRSESHSWPPTVTHYSL